MQIPSVFICVYLRLFVLALLPDQFRDFGAGIRSRASLLRRDRHAEWGAFRVEVEPNSRLTTFLVGSGFFHVVRYRRILLSLLLPFHATLARDGPSSFS